MESLDNIWDLRNDSEQAVPRTLKRKQHALFLADSDDDDNDNDIPPRQGQKAPPDIDIDIDAMFADVEDGEDDPFNFKPLPPALDTDALKREAEKRHQNTTSTLTPHAILPSSSPQRDTERAGSKNAKEDVTGKGNVGKKERRKLVRLDEGMLLGPTGFPQLIKDTKKFNTKGKGHEITDLNRLLRVYQFWTHAMYPKTTFGDTVQRVEKLCHSKRMNVALSVWRDEFRGTINGGRAEVDQVIDLTDQGDPTTTTTASHSAQDSDGVEYASSSSRAPSRPPSSGTEQDDDDFDIDAIIREEEERRAKEREAAGMGKEGEIRDGTETERGDVRERKKKMAVNYTEDEDETMWNELDAVLTQAVPAPQPPPANPAPVSLSTADDEDMWDVVRALENPPTSEKPPSATMIPAAETAPVAPGTVPDDDDWEDMYL